MPGGMSKVRSNIEGRMTGLGSGTIRVMPGGGEGRGGEEVAHKVPLTVCGNSMHNDDAVGMVNLTASISVSGDAAWAPQALPNCWTDVLNSASSYGNKTNPKGAHLLENCN